ncbi:unnamed protein product [Schistocephalus solidus]|uniref:Cyanocobalamin reductase (cyanide-eliminating) n=1 Tax=Schistocephalus solidus TaxID=70667 RepID=A0A183TFX5_SCHSO|nr:unnamed protein product [Schistocephalus solidus]
MACSPNLTVYNVQLPFGASPSSTTEPVTISTGDVDAIVDAFNSLLKHYGFEVHPFLVGWYNELCSPRLQLSGCPPDQLALCIISTPEMFERSFLPHIIECLSCAPNLTASYEQFNWPKHFSSQDHIDRSVYLRITHAVSVFSDRLDECHHLQGVIEQIKECFWSPDYALQPVTRMPLVHSSAAGHAAGVAYFHSPSEAVEVGVKESSEVTALGVGTPHRLFGCSLHPYHGGWFGFRGVLMFPKVRCPDLPRKQPRSSLPPGTPPFDPVLVRNLLTEYTCHWRNQKWREFGLDTSDEASTVASTSADGEELPTQRYSLAARIFFNTACNKRLQLLELWAKEGVPKFNLLQE